jgi:hypothetical protein
MYKSNLNKKQEDKMTPEEKVKNEIPIERMLDVPETKICVQCTLKKGR